MLISESWESDYRNSSKLWKLHKARQSSNIFIPGKLCKGFTFSSNLVYFSLLFQTSAILEILFRYLILCPILLAVILSLVSSYCNLSTYYLASKRAAKKIWVGRSLETLRRVALRRAGTCHPNSYRQMHYLESFALCLVRLCAYFYMCQQQSVQFSAVF